MVRRAAKQQTDIGPLPAILSHMARPWPAYLMWLWPFFAHVVFVNKNASPLWVAEFDLTSVHYSPAHLIAQRVSNWLSVSLKSRKPVKLKLNDTFVMNSDTIRRRGHTKFTMPAIHYRLLLRNTGLGHNAHARSIHAAVIRRSWHRSTRRTIRKSGWQSDISTREHFSGFRRSSPVITGRWR